MLHPDFDTFQRLAKPGALVPVYREIMADLETPVSAYHKISENQPYSFLLESVEKADKIGRYSFLGANPSIVFRSRGNDVTLLRGADKQTYQAKDPLDELRKHLSGYHAVEVDGLPNFHGGAVGYLAYDEVR